MLTHDQTYKQRGVGALPREAALGDFIEAWKKAFDDASFTVVNAANAIGNLFSTKDEQEQVRLPFCALLWHQRL